jgi:triacylglycerol lipase
MSASRHKSSELRYKKATIALSVFFALAIAVVVVFAVIFAKQTSVAKKLGGAFGGAVTNKKYCDAPGVVCEFTPDPSIGPPVIHSPSTGYSADSAAFGAQVVATLESAFSDSVDPVHLKNTRVVALLSTPDNLQIGWVLQTLDGSQVWLAFRGTETTAEWKQDLNLKQTAWRDSNTILVHSGFHGIYEAVRDALRATLQPLASSTLFIVGHSLGAALALLCAADMAKTPIMADTRVYVFAPPRVGNAAFVDMVTSAVPVKLQELYLIANHADVVPDLPLAVEPNFQTYDSPWLYAQFPLMVFSANWGSTTLNHVLPIYIAHLRDVHPCPR